MTLTALPLAALWDQMLAVVRADHPDLARAWFVDLEPLGLRQGVFRVRTANEAQRRYLDRVCRRSFADAAQALTGCLVTVSFESDAGEVPGKSALRDESPICSIRNPDYTFDLFVEGPCNRMALAGARAVAVDPGNLYNPLVLHGGAGLGKSHLLQSIAHSVDWASSEHQVCYLTCDDFTRLLVEAAEDDRQRDFQYRLGGFTYLLVDDIDRLAERQRSQEVFFHLINQFCAPSRQIVVTSTQDPCSLPGIAPRIRSRLSAGLVALLEVPCRETMVNIIRSKAMLGGFDLEESLIQIIAGSPIASVAELERNLLRMEALAQTGDGRVSETMVREVFEGPRTHPVELRDILIAVTRKFQVDVADLLGAGRTRTLSRARQVAMYLARELTELSLEKIGEGFGGRDHSTVLHATVATSERLETDARLRKQVGDLVDEIRNAHA